MSGGPIRCHIEGGAFWRPLKVFTEGSPKLIDLLGGLGVDGFDRAECYDIPAAIVIYHIDETGNSRQGHDIWLEAVHDRRSRRAGLRFHLVLCDSGKHVSFSLEKSVNRQRDR